MEGSIRGPGGVRQAGRLVNTRPPALDKELLHVAIKKQVMHFSPFFSAAVNSDKGSGPFSITLRKGAGEKVASKGYSSFK